MLRSLHAYASAFLSRMLSLYREAGVLNSVAIILTGIDDRQLKRFDRKYKIRTTGFIELEHTSFERTKLRQATNYGPVNGWALQRLFRHLNLPRTLRFADLGSGLGRACIVAAEYGFTHVTGVELAEEFCGIARDNVARCRPPSGRLSPITVLQMDALDYCRQCDDDVFFMYRPFSGDFLERILSVIADRSRTLNKRLIVIYAERVAKPQNFSRCLTANDVFRKITEVDFWGQSFWVYETRVTPTESH